MKQTITNGFQGRTFMDRKIFVEMAADIVSAHASVNEMTTEQLLGELQSVYQKLLSLAGGEVEDLPAVAGSVERMEPAMPVDKAFGTDKVYCLVCGKAFTTLKKHLSTAHGLDPKGYRKAFGIPSATPLVARNYSESKKKMAQKLGLADKLAEGRKKRAQKKG
jgi:predicted transcriptional regulator